MNIEKFTFEEICLLRVFDAASREGLRSELAEGIDSVNGPKEPELVALFSSVMAKMNEITDEEFAELGIFARGLDLADV